MIFIRVLFAAACAVALVACSEDEPVATPSASPGTAVSVTPEATPVLQTREITVSQGTATARLVAEIAVTPAERQTGLMLRESLPGDAAMLFVFRGENRTGFWMKDTLVPLTIAYLDGDGTVMEMRDGTPGDQTLLTPAKPYRYVLEVNRGWFQRNGLAVGAAVKIPADLPQAQ